MKITTLCYIEKDRQYLMLHRVKKTDDANRDKWIGVGGHLEVGECPDDCLLREVSEETGLSLTDFRFRGLVTFVSDTWEQEFMCLYTADAFSGTLKDCDEGVLKWVPFEHIPSLPLWQGDHIFLRLLQENRPFFSLKLVYSGEKLTEAVLDGSPLAI